MSSKVTVELLSELKKLPADVLRSFGLTDDDRGVLFTYRMPDGSLARTRVRHALRGAEGSSWLDGDERPITAYLAPVGTHFDNPREMIIVEGESDCWVGWHAGINVVGIPGADNVDALTAWHLVGIDTVLIQREKLTGASKTFPLGIDDFIERIVVRLRKCGFSGRLSTIEMPGNFSDMADLFVASPEGFLNGLASASLKELEF